MRNIGETRFFYFSSWFFAINAIFCYAALSKTHLFILFFLYVNVYFHKTQKKKFYCISSHRLSKTLSFIDYFCSSATFFFCLVYFCFLALSYKNWSCTIVCRVSIKSLSNLRCPTLVLKAIRRYHFICRKLEHEKKRICIPLFL